MAKKKTLKSTSHIQDASMIVRPQAVRTRVGVRRRRVWTMVICLGLELATLSIWRRGSQFVRPPGKNPSAPDEGSDTGGKPVVHIECDATKEIPWGKEGRLSL